MEPLSPGDARVLVLAGALAWVACSDPPAPAADGPDEALPNVVLFLADDMGLGDTSAYQDWTGNGDTEQLRTPNLDRLAAMGVRFTDAHAPSSTCTPTRYALLTGRYAWRTRLKHKVLLGPYAHPLIEPDRPTLASLLRGAGYRTGMVGKWHLGLVYGNGRGEPADSWSEVDLREPLLDGPLDHGFDYAFFTPRSQVESRPTGWIENRRVVGANPHQRTSVSGYDPRQTGVESFEHALAFLNGHLAGADRDRPFFLYYAAHANHPPPLPSGELNGFPVRGRSRFVDGTPAGARGDYVFENDVAVGELLKFLRSHEDPRRPGAMLLDDTLFVFASDNGSDDPKRASVGPLRGKKGRIYEGGHRVPLIVAWSAGGVGDGDAYTPGASSNALVGLNDLFATLAELTGQAEAPAEAASRDSESALVALREPGAPGTGRRTLVVHDDSGLGPALALREGRWKLVASRALVEDGVVEPLALFDLDANLAELESENLVGDPAQATRIAELSEALLQVYRAP